MAAGAAAAQRFQHPFQAIGRMDQRALESAVARVMEMDDQSIARLISENVPIHLVGCPACGGGAQDTGASVWSLDDPWRVACRHCGMKFPNERYPLNGELKLVNPRGQPQVYRYYDGGSEKRRYFFEGAAQEQIKQYLTARAYDFARLYAATKDPRYAHKAAVILDRFAQVYPGWPVHGNEGNYANWKTFFTSAPYPVQSGKWGRWIHDELPTELALAYDLIHDSAAFAELSRSRGVDVRMRVENDLFRASVELVRRYPRYLGASGMNGTAAGMIAIGRAIEDAGYVEDGLRRVQDALAAQFFFDGTLNSGSPAYELQTVRALRYPAALARGYTELDLEAQPMFQKAWAAVRSLLLPDGRYAPLHDSWARSRFTQDQPLSESRSVLLPAYGHAVLGRGSGANQIQAQLHFGYHAGHAHADQLNLLLFAKGKEMLSDIGYTHTKLRPWAMSTLGHNTVVIDDLNQAITQGWIPASWWRLDRFETGQPQAVAGPVFGSLLLYDARHDHVQVVEAESSHGYSHVPGLKEYRRLIALVPASGADAYVVDIFRVRGGSHHMWAAHGSAYEDQRLETSVALRPRDGTLLGPGTHYSAERDPELDGESFKGAIYGLIDGLASSETSGAWSATWRSREEPGAALKLTMLGGRPARITAGQAPSILRAGEDNLKVDQFKMPLLMVERPGGSDNAFVAVWEPFAAQPFISQVRALEFEGDAGDAVGLAVQIGGRTDYILSDPEGARLRKVKGVDLSFRGRFAVVSDAFLHLSDGDFLAKGACELRGSDPANGRILAARRDGFETDARLPPAEAMRNKLLLVRHPDNSTQAYTIERLEQRAGRWFIGVAGGTGLEPLPDATGYRQIFFPRAEFKTGAGTFVLPNSLCMVRD